MKKNYTAILLIAIIALITMLPLYTSGYKLNHDTKFHIASIVSTTSSIKNDTFPTKILPNMANDFGYGTHIFYPPLTHNSIAYIDMFVNNHVVSIQIFYYLVLFLSGVTMYFLSKKISNNCSIGLLSAVIYMLFPYHITNIYVRDAQSETLLFVFLPLIISGLYELYQRNTKQFYILFVLGYVGGMLSHLTMMVYFTFVILVAMLFNLKNTLKKFKPLIIASIFILFITSFFTVPIVEHRLLGTYRVFQENVMVNVVYNESLGVFDYLDFFWPLNN